MPSPPHDPDALPRARFKSTPEDFVVEELPAYPASGQGEHLFVTIEKRFWTTEQAARALARHAQVDPRAVGWAGQKDRVGVTTQRLSLPWPIARPVEGAFEGLAEPGLRVLDATRHGNKLKPGHLEGNRFDIVLRDLAPGDAARIAERLERAGREGIPNAFGPQRFGRDGQNPERALGWLAGKERGPRDRKLERLLFSSLQSLLFNDVLAARVADDTWRTVLPGDVAKRADSGGLFEVPLEGAELEDARARAEAGAVSATGPLFGASMRSAAGAARDREEAALTARGLSREAFDAHPKLGEGTRRPLRILAADLSLEAGDTTLRVRVTLPKGAYATTLLGLACTLDEPRPPPTSREPEAASAGTDREEPSDLGDEGSTAGQ